MTLATADVAVSTLWRISRHSSGEPFFGRSAGNRFDDRSPVKSRRFGTCYCGFDLPTAIAETVLHDEIAQRGQFSLAYSQVDGRQLVRFAGDRLVLADLTGVALKTLGADGSISTVTPYSLPQRWAMAVHRHPQHVDGILYVSRHLNDRKAAVVFERARARLGTARYTPLANVAGALSAMALLHVSFDYA